MVVFAGTFKSPRLFHRIISSYVPKIMSTGIQNASENIEQEASHSITFSYRRTDTHYLN